MSTETAAAVKPSSPPSFAEQFTPKLVTTFREGYRLSQLRADAVAGLTVAIVALPLSMAIAIASGASPAQGFYTAIVGGFLVSALGGSRFQIGGPAGAFIVLVAATVEAHGMDGLIIATLLSGLLLLAIGFLRLGAYIKFIPYPVTVGFTAGIAVIIFASQIKDILGLDLAGPEPGPLVEKLPVLWRALPSMGWSTLALAGLTILSIQWLKRRAPRVPGMLAAIAGAAAATALWDLPVDTVGSRFGGIPSGFPAFRVPDLSLAKAYAVFPSAVAFTLLGAIESLLSAVVADGMTGQRHRSNCELVAQGVANIGSALCGGICVTGAVARTATNVRAGAHGPVAGMLHAVFLLIFILVAAPLASYIPLASLAGVLAIIAWNMVEKQAFWTLLRASRGDAAVLLSTFGLTVFRDLTEAIVVGFALGSMLFIHRMSQVTAVETRKPFVPDDGADDAGEDGRPYDERSMNDPDIVVYRISGVFFFGAAGTVGSVLDHIGDRRRALVIDFSMVPFADATAANTMEAVVRKAAARGIAVYFSGLSPAVRREFFMHGLRPPRVRYESSIATALSKARRAG